MRITRTLPIFLLLTAATKICADPAPPAPSLDEIIAQLRQSDPDKKLDAAVQLQDFASHGLTDAQAMTLLNAAAESSASPDAAIGDPAGQFILAAASHPNADGLAFIDKHLEKFSDAAKAAGIEYMVRVKSPESLKLFAAAFPKYAGKLDWDPSMGKSLAAALPNDDVLAALVQGLAEKNSVDLCTQALSDAAGAEGAGKVPPDFLAGHVKEISAAFEPWIKKLAAMIPTDADPAKKYRWSEDYRNALETAEYFPLLLAHAGPGAEPVLREALTLKDPRLSLFAIRALLQLKLDVPQADIDLVAADDEMRNFLYNTLEKLHAADRFPEKFRTQDEFALSEIVSWLTYPTELNHPPSAIELMKSFEIDTHSKDGIVVMYLYRFKDAPDDAWDSAICGVYPKSQIPTTRNLGQTFSDFERYDALTLDQHIAKITQQVQDEWQQKAEAAASQPTTQ